MKEHIKPETIELLSKFGKLAIARATKQKALEVKYALELTQFLLKNPKFKENVTYDNPEKKNKKGRVNHAKKKGKKTR